MTDLEANSLEQGLYQLGFKSIPTIHYNLDKTRLITSALSKGEGRLTDSGAFVVNTSPYTGRSPNDKYIVKNPDPDLWYATGTEEVSRETADAIKAEMLSHLEGKELFVRDVQAGADPKYAVGVRVVTELAWQNLAASNMFLPYNGATLPAPDLTVIAATSFAADPKKYGLRSGTFIILDLEAKLVLIGNTRYAGEIKKSVFTYLNYILPKKGILSLHCSANKGADDDVALFFGLSGTGKTTLSSDQERMLIGDDEHGWSDDDVFNFEGGCYAKTIRINPEYEPLVWSAINRFGCLIENVPLDVASHPDFDSAEITENTRAAYPLTFIPNYEPTGMGPHPKHIFLLTADAFGVLPPLARLTDEQAMFYFLSGYTSKLAGTERGLGDKPQATFSTCFGAPFLPLKPSIYATLLDKKLKEHDTKVWLLNTGWAGGGFGVGSRISLPLTRAMIKAVLSNSLNHIPTHKHPIFNLDIPDHVEGVPEEMLDPEKSWLDKQAYESEASALAEKFKENFKKYRDSLSEAVVNSGPF